MIKITAYHAGQYGTGLIGIEFHGEMTDEQRAKLPKYVGWTQKYGDRSWMRVTLRADGVNGGKNEAGIKRIRKMLEVLDGDFVFKAGVAGNAHASLEEFKQAHGI